METNERETGIFKQFHSTKLGAVPAFLSTIPEVGRPVALWGMTVEV